jgi:hypothetical protein
MIDFHEVDPILFPWAESHRLKVFTSDRDAPVRSMDIVLHRIRYQVWIEVAGDHAMIVHLCGYFKKFKILKIEASVPTLEKALDDCLATVSEWDRQRPIWCRLADAVFSDQSPNVTP